MGMLFQYRGLSQKAGVYQILNLLNGRAYFGSCRRFKERWSEHRRLLNLGKHKNSFLQRDFVKSGEEFFVFSVLQVVEGERNLRLAVEQQYLDANYDNQYQCYNFDRYAHSREGKKSRTPEATRERMSKSHMGIKRGPHSEISKEKMALAKRGRKHSEETKLKISIAKQGKKRPDTRERLLRDNPMKNGHSEETKRKISESRKKKLIKEQVESSNASTGF